MGACGVSTQRRWDSESWTLASGVVSVVRSRRLWPNHARGSHVTRYPGTLPDPCSGPPLDASGCRLKRALAMPPNRAKVLSYQRFARVARGGCQG